MRLEYQELLKAHPGIEDRLNGFPTSIFSGRERPTDRATGVFFCFRLPAWDTSAEAFTLEIGPVHWYLYDLMNTKILDEPREIVEHVRSTPETPRVVATNHETLVEIRDKVHNHIKNGYLRQIGWSQDSPNPALSCWMELNDG